MDKNTTQLHGKPVNLLVAGCLICVLCVFLDDGQWYPGKPVGEGGGLCLLGTLKYANFVHFWL